MAVSSGNPLRDAKNPGLNLSPTLEEEGRQTSPVFDDEFVVHTHCFKGQEGQPTAIITETAVSLDDLEKSIHRIFCLACYREGRTQPIPGLNIIGIDGNGLSQTIELTAIFRKANNTAQFVSSAASWIVDTDPI